MPAASHPSLDKTSCNSPILGLFLVYENYGFINTKSILGEETRIFGCRFEMERSGLTVKDLEPMIGKSNRVYEILNHKRSLTLKMIWKLHEGLGIPAESLIKPPQAHA